MKNAETATRFSGKYPLTAESTDSLIRFFTIFFSTASLAVTLVNAIKLYLPWELYFAVYLLLMLSGWGLQTFFCNASDRKHRQQFPNAEDTRRVYRSSKIAPTAIAGLVLALLAIPLVKDYLRMLSETHEDEYYDEFSVTPYVIAFFLFAGVLVGAVVCFLPTDMHERPLFQFGCPALLFGSTALGVQTGTETLNALCILSCAALWLFGLCRGNLVRTRVNSTFDGRIPANVKNTNLVATGLLAAAVLLLTVLAYVALRGIFTLIVLLLVFIGSLFSAGKRPEGVYEGGEGIIFQANLAEQVDTPDYVYLLIFLAVMLPFAVLFFSRFSRRGRALLERVTKFLQNLFRLFLDALASLFRFSGNEGTCADMFANYVDETEAVGREEMNALRTDGAEYSRYRDFLSALQKKKDLRAQFRFAYFVYVTARRKKGRGLFPSDTPRETERKLSERASSPEEKQTVRAVSAEFEKTEFAGKTADRETAKIAESLLAEIRKQFD